MQAALRIAARLALALALLSGWSAGLLHPFKHVDEAGRLVHLAGAAGSDPGQTGSPAADKLCDVLAGLAACLPGSAASFATPGGTAVAVLHAVGEPRPAGAPPFFAQGPPILL